MGTKLSGPPRRHLVIAISFYHPTKVECRLSANSVENCCEFVLYPDCGLFRKLSISDTDKPRFLYTGILMELLQIGRAIELVTFCLVQCRADTTAVDLLQDQTLGIVIVEQAFTYSLRAGIFDRPEMSRVRI
jgi:hypothetical protein